MLRKHLIVLALALGIVSPALAQNYQATQGAGTTFGTKLVGGVNYPQYVFCDPATPAQCVAVNASGQMTIANTSFAVTNAGTFAVQLTGATNNINNIAGTVSLPTGASTSANQSTAITALTGVTVTTTHGCSITGYGVLGCLGQIDDDIKGSIPAGTNLIGKVGIDQTTPGTTNGVQVNAALPAGTNKIGSVDTASNVTPTDCSGTVATGGTAQNAITAQSSLHGLTIMNLDTSEPMWISFTTTAAASTAGSYPLQAATASTFASPGNFTSPPGFGTNHALSVIAATTGHKFSCTWW